MILEFEVTNWWNREKLDMRYLGVCVEDDYFEN